MDGRPGKGEDRGGEPVTVYRAPDSVRLGLARSLLESVGIPCQVAGEGLQDLFGAGRLGGYNLLVGPAEVRVPAGREAEAREVLRELLEE
jgi:hypothetical protein